MATNSMICVSIGRGRHRHMIAEHRHLAEIGVGLVELRLDFIQGRVQIQRLLHDRPCPVIITCRRTCCARRSSRGLTTSTSRTTSPPGFPGTGRRSGS
jgi:hypothetical protein